MSQTDDPITDMMDRVLGYCRSQGLGTVARLGVPDQLVAGPQTADDVAARCDADPESLYRMLRALAVEGVFEDLGERRFGLTPLSETLTTEHPQSLRWFAASMCDAAHWRPWGHCFDVVSSGASQTEKVLGAGPWEYLSAHPAEAQRFGQAMSSMSAQAISAITAHYDFSGLETIVDVGGSRGALLLALLATNPSLRGTVLDLPEVIDVSRREVEGHAHADRLEFTAGSFFESVPTGADAYVLKHILHDWPDRECSKILGVIREAIPDHGRLLVFDALLVPEAPPWAHWLDVHMMVLQNGKERSPDEFAALFAASGFELTLAQAIPAPVAILEARPV